MKKIVVALMFAASIASAAEEDIEDYGELCPGGICPIPGLALEEPGAVATAPVSPALEEPGTVATTPVSPATEEPGTVATAPGKLALEAFEVVRTQAGDPGASAFAAFIRGEAAAENAFEKALKRGGVPLLALALLAAGFMLNLTPCTLPLVPVNLALLGIGAGRSSRKAGFCKGLSFGAGMAASYGALGLVAAKTGRMFGKVNGSAVFAAAVAAVFLLLALASLGVFNIDFAALRNFAPRRRRSGTAARRGGAAAPLGLMPAFAAGAGVAVLAGACVAPALVSALVLSADLSSRGVAAGVFVPFALGLGMAAPWPLVGAGFAALPKPGAWMAHVKKAFAAIFAAMAAVYAARAWALCAPGGAAARSWSKPPAQGALKFLADETAAAELALAAGKPLLVEFSADWCSACHAMEKGTLAAPEVVAAIDGAHGGALLKIDCTDTADPAVEAALTRFGVRGLPFFAVLRPKE